MKHDKLESFKDLEYFADMELILGTLKEQKQRKPSEIVDKMIAAALNVIYYVNNLHINRRSYEYIIEQLHDSKRELQIKIRELEEQITDINLNRQLDETGGND